MQFASFASGSSGNCTLVSGAGANVIIDAGISMRRIKRALSENGVPKGGLSAILITHEHTDHISALPMLLKYISVPVYAPPKAAAFIRTEFSACADFIHDMPVGEELSFNGLSVRSFATPHDAVESCGYIFSENGKTFAYATDTGRVTDEMLSNMLGASAAVVEANHDPEMLRFGPYPEYLKSRITSGFGHLSNSECGSLAVQLWEAGATQLILAHISKENNTPTLALRTIGEALMHAGAVPGRDIVLCAAQPNGTVGPFEVV